MKWNTNSGEVERSSERSDVERSVLPFGSRRVREILPVPPVTSSVRRVQQSRLQGLGQRPIADPARDSACCGSRRRRALRRRSSGTDTAWRVAPAALRGSVVPLLWPRPPSGRGVRTRTRQSAPLPVARLPPRVRQRRPCNPTPLRNGPGKGGERRPGGPGPAGRSRGRWTLGSSPLPRPPLPVARLPLRVRPRRRVIPHRYVTDRGRAAKGGPGARGRPGAREVVGHLAHPVFPVRRSRGVPAPPRSSTPPV